MPIISNICVDDKLSGLNAQGVGNPTESTIYRLEIMRMELTSVYGVQVCISHSPLSIY